MMQKQMISFTDPQRGYLMKEARRLGISVADLVRRIVDAWREKALSESSKPIPGSEPNGFLDNLVAVHGLEIIATDPKSPFYDLPEALFQRFGEAYLPFSKHITGWTPERGYDEAPRNST